jgi:RNA polymerase sigma factor (sigma-70 family)
LVDEDEFSDFLQQDFELDQIKEAMEMLDELSKEIVFLRFIEDKSYTEIEEQLEISQDAIRQRISRALKKLKDLLNS